MSKRIIEHDFDRELEVTVGYNAVLETFYAQIGFIDLSDQEREHNQKNLLLWLGTTSREIVTTDELAGRIGIFCSIPTLIMELLEADRVTAIHQPNELQQTILRVIQQNWHV